MADVNLIQSIIIVALVLFSLRLMYLLHTIARKAGNGILALTQETKRQAVIIKTHDRALKNQAEAITKITGYYTDLIRTDMGRNPLDDRRPRP